MFGSVRMFLELRKQLAASKKIKKEDTKDNKENLEWASKQSKLATIWVTFFSAQHVCCVSSSSPYWVERGNYHMLAELGFCFTVVATLRSNSLLNVALDSSHIVFVNQSTFGIAKRLRFARLVTNRWWFIVFEAAHPGNNWDSIWDLQRKKNNSAENNT